MSAEKEEVVATTANAEEQYESSDSTPKDGKKTKKQKKERRKTCERWTSLEDDLLAKAIDKFGEKNWNEIAKFVGTKNGDQCNQHWHRVLNPKISKKPWTKEEDDKLMDRVDQYGESSWKNVAEGFSGRTDIQCRHRWMMLKKQASQGRGRPLTSSPKAPLTVNNCRKRKRSNEGDSSSQLLPSDDMDSSPLSCEDEKDMITPFEQEMIQFTSSSTSSDSKTPSAISLTSSASSNDSSCTGTCDEFFDYACKGEFQNPLPLFSKNQTNEFVLDCSPQALGHQLQLQFQRQELFQACLSISSPAIPSPVAHHADTQPLFSDKGFFNVSDGCCINNFESPSKESTSEQDYCLNGKDMSNGQDYDSDSSSSFSSSSVASPDGCIRMQQSASCNNSTSSSSNEFDELETPCAGSQERIVNSIMENAFMAWSVYLTREGKTY